MSTETATTPAPHKTGPAKPAVKVSHDVHRVIALRKVREGGKIEQMVDDALRIAFARELAELEA